MVGALHGLFATLCGASSQRTNDPACFEYSFNTHLPLLVGRAGFGNVRV
jgi:hypothetical protein